MLEIILLWNLCRKISEKRRGNGRSGKGYGTLLVALWFLGEIFGAIACGVVVVATGNGANNDPPILAIYGGALVGAALGAFIAFLLAGRQRPEAALAAAGFDDSIGTAELR